MVKKHSNDEGEKDKSKVRRKTKISKSKDGKTFSPIQIINKFGADCIRYWASSGTLGTDIVYDEIELLNIKKLLTKIWNAARFAQGFLQDFDIKKEVELRPVDKWIRQYFNETLKTYHSAFKKHEFFLARNALEKFFVGYFCDNYLELIKNRLYKPEIFGQDSCDAAKKNLHYLLLEQIKLFAPYIPHLTEEIYQEMFATDQEKTTLHTSILAKSCTHFEDKDSFLAGNYLLDLLKLVRAAKSKHNYSMKLAIKKLVIHSEDKKHEDLLLLIEEDLKATANIQKVTYGIESNFISQNNSVEFSIQGEQFLIIIFMDEDEIELNKLIQEIRTSLNEQKKLLGMKSKSSIESFFIWGDKTILSLLKKDISQLKSSLRTKDVFFEQPKESTNNNYQYQSNLHFTFL